MVTHRIAPSQKAAGMTTYLPNPASRTVPGDGGNIKLTDTEERTRRALLAHDARRGLVWRESAAYPDGEPCFVGEGVRDA